MPDGSVAQVGTQAISQAATLIIMSAQAAVLIVFTALYVAYLSMVAFVLTTAVAVTTSVKGAPPRTPTERD